MNLEIVLAVALEHGCKRLRRALRYRPRTRKSASQADAGILQISLQVNLKQKFPPFCDKARLKTAYMYICMQNRIHTHPQPAAGCF